MQFLPTQFARSAGSAAASSPVALGLAFLLAPSVAAHQFWLAPAILPDAESDPVRIHAFVGEGLRGDPVRYSAPYTDSFSLHTAAASGAAGDARPCTLDLAARATNGDATFARLDCSAEVLVSFVSHFTTHEMEAGAFLDYLQEEGLPVPAPWATETAHGLVRERYRRSAKLYLPGTGDPSGRGGVAGAIGSSPRVDPCTPLGLPLEIVPLTDPARGGPIRFAVQSEGAPVASARVRAWRSPDARVVPSARSEDAAIPRFEGTTDAEGTVVVPVDANGAWLLAVVQLIPSQDPTADWESTWASLSFFRRAESARVE